MSRYTKSYVDIPEFFLEDGILVGTPKSISAFPLFSVVKVGNVPFNLKHGTPFGIFLLSFLNMILGEEWVKYEKSKLNGKKHLLVKWQEQMKEYFAKGTLKKDLALNKLSGNYMSLITFAYDIYSIYHNGNELPKDLLEKIRATNDNEKTSILGSMYEIRIAAIFSRAGYDIDWYSSKKRTIPEFKAKHKYFGDEIAVEAKTISRKGVFTTTGNKEHVDTLRTLAGSALLNAVEKKTKENVHPDFKNLPYYIFIDMNWPNEEEVEKTFDRWFTGMTNDKKFLSTVKSTKENPSEFTSLFLTNFSWHYNDMKPVPGNSQFAIFENRFLKYDTSRSEHLALLHVALDQYLYATNHALFTI